MSKKKKPSDWKEARRFQAVALLKKKWTQARIAEALSVTPGAVSQWIRRFEVEGGKSLRSIPRPGAPSRLTDDQRDQIPELLCHGAEAYGFRGNIWTCSRISRVIKNEFGVEYDKRHVARIMKSIGWTPHKPVIRATQRKEEEIERWRTHEWPALKKSPKTAKNTISPR